MLGGFGSRCPSSTPTPVKPFAKKHVKTDRIDSRVLAELLRMDHLPESYVPEGEIRDLRIEAKHRASLVRTRTQVKNKIHASLAREGVQTNLVISLGGEWNF
ncbi:MAG: hypothetical protein DRO92_00260 [Candidatus Altiarchaeales archaeon]|nr:MAG: hypothetical protein DRO92_00260 [Candidatus Altiarchaeales archaeon]